MDKEFTCRNRGWDRQKDALSLQSVTEITSGTDIPQQWETYFTKYKILKIE